MAIDWDKIKEDYDLREANPEELPPTFTGKEALVLDIRASDGFNAAALQDDHHYKHQLYLIVSDTTVRLSL